MMELRPVSIYMYQSANGRLDCMAHNILSFVVGARYYIMLLGCWSSILYLVFIWTDVRKTDHKAKHGINLHILKILL